jgi:hypothetical protein
VNVFDFWNGADFKIKVKIVDGKYPNYDDSVFLPSRTLTDPNDNALSDEQLEDIWKNQMYSLKAFVDPSEFKSYEELQAKFYKIVGKVAQPTMQAESVPQMNYETEQAPFEPDTNLVDVDEDDDDEISGLDYYKSLTEDD